MKKFINTILIMLFIVLGILIIIKYDICKNAVLKGIMLCSNVIIPSLFPFTVCVMFLINSNALTKIPFLNILGKPFYLNSEEFTIFLLSTIGGYPIGSKMISQLYESGKVTLKKAQIMTCFCINAGPAFIISVVGKSILHNQKIGIILFLSHIISSFIMAFLLGKNFKEKSKTQIKETFISPVDNFVLSTSQAARAILNICFYIILFTVITEYSISFSASFPFLRYITFFLEVTIGVSYLRNIYAISFILGFAGVCIWFQVLSISRKYKLSIIYLIISRISHGIISMFFTFIFVKLFGIEKQVFSNDVIFLKIQYFGPISISISVAILVLFFLLNITSKKYSGNITEDLL